MDGGVQVMWREMVKPSSEIHPKKMKLSYLDQTIPRSVYVPIIFFYQADESKGLTTSKHAQISKQLKQSLSDTLTLFYPLAGRVEVDDHSTVVDCNDVGVEFIEARVHAQLVDILKGPDVEDYYKLRQYCYIPVVPITSEWPFLFLQITFFDCGGIGLGICFSHLFADCHSIMMFINAWASSCRSEEIPQTVSFDLANYFPAREVLPMGIGEPIEVSNKKLIRTKMLVFDKEKIGILKQGAISSMVKDPTRVEVISAFIWKFMLDKCAMETKTVAAIHAVNLRGRKKPLEKKFGNCCILSVAYADDGVVEFDALVTKLRRSIRKIDDKFIEELQNGNDAYMEEINEGCFFSSWCRFPFYHVDYGFGTPILFCPVMAAESEFFVLVNNKTGENIECWVTMEHHIIQILENQINHISTTTL